MDQDSFRKLLQVPRPDAKDTSSLLVSSKTNPKTTESKPAFKPRKVNKEANAKYRDRAAERRTGGSNDYAQVEAVLEDFERRAADAEDKSAVEEQRRYLGGDSDHSVIVKGLDIALLEQNKARASKAINDDDTLEQTFLEVAKEKEVPKKRTREDLIRELKEKRDDGVSGKDRAKTKEDEAELLEEAKKMGKFKPIGFTPIGGGGEKRKKKKRKDGIEGEKKRRKLEGGSQKKEQDVDDEVTKAEMPPPKPVSVSPAAATHPELELEPEPDADFDIFAGVAEYEGIDLGDDGDDDGTQQPKPDGVASAVAGQWFTPEEGEHLPTPPPLQSSVSPPPKARSRSPQLIPDDDEEGGESSQPMRLIPLESSAIPSIKDLLALDEAQDKKKHKGKKKGANEGGGGQKAKLSAEIKAERDYKRLQSYSKKKAEG